MTVSASLIRQIEEASFSAWPSLAQVLDDGWVLRFSKGHSMRANSVNPNYPALGDTDAKIARAESWYSAHRLPPLFRLTPLADPSDLDQRLDARGYRLINPGDAFYLASLGVQAAPTLLPENITVKLDAGPHDGWLQAYLAMAQLETGRAAALGRVLDAVVPTARYGWLSQDGQPLAAAFAVVQGTMMVTCNVITAPAARRRGLMRALLGRLTGWAIEEGATAGGLFVVGSNKGAAALYRSLGYEELYRYHYRIAPSS
ncbi:acyl-CoA N-acyltransferase [Thozetella sp. PMI_491]|nr:acyl-CoA N-acyltransferase [Thozetella sp. PMI_491]